MTKFQVIERWSASDPTKERVYGTYSVRKHAEEAVDRLNRTSMWSAYHVRDVEVEDDPVR